jgi:uncharacterized protein (DUF2267 family)
MNRRIIRTGERVTTIGCYSEVLMHMGLAGRRIEVELLPSLRAAQCYRDGRPAGGPVTTGEAGLHRDGDEFHVEEAGTDDAGDDDPHQVMADVVKLLDDAIRSSGANVLTITNLGL